MNISILFVSIVILLCIVAEKFSGKFGMPALILFMFIGMLFGSDGIFKISFDNFELTENICSIALLFIMFYGRGCTFVYGCGQCFLNPPKEKIEFKIRNSFSSGNGKRK